MFRLAPVIGNFLDPQDVGRLCETSKGQRQEVHEHVRVPLLRAFRRWHSVFLYLRTQPCDEGTQPEGLLQMLFGLKGAPRLPSQDIVEQTEPLLQLLWSKSKDNSLALSVNRLAMLYHWLEFERAFDAAETEKEKEKEAWTSLAFLVAFSIPGQGKGFVMPSFASGVAKILAGASFWQEFTEPFLHIILATHTFFLSFRSRSQSRHVPPFSTWPALLTSLAGFERVEQDEEEEEEEDIEMIPDENEDDENVKKTGLMKSKRLSGFITTMLVTNSTILPLLTRWKIDCNALSVLLRFLLDALQGKSPDRKTLDEIVRPMITSKVSPEVALQLTGFFSAFSAFV